VPVVLACDAQTDVHKLLSVVDMALYRAEKLGRNHVEAVIPAAPAEPDARLDSPSIVPIVGSGRAAIGAPATRSRAAS